MSDQEFSLPEDIQLGMLELDKERRLRVGELLSMISPQAGAFVFEYVKSLNATEAARAVGYKGSTVANNLLNNPAVQELIGLLLEHQIGKEEVINRIVQIARFDYGDLLKRNEETGFTDFDLEGAKAKGLTYAIKSFSFGKQGVRVEVYDKLTALNMLAKHLGLLTDKVETGNGAFKVLVQHVKREVGGGGEED